MAERRGQLEGSLFNSCYTKFRGWRYSFPHLLLMRTLQCWELSKAESTAIFWVFGVTRSGIGTRSPELYIYIHILLTEKCSINIAVSNIYKWRVPSISDRASADPSNHLYWLVTWSDDHIGYKLTVTEPHWLCVTLS